MAWIHYTGSSIVSQGDGLHQGNSGDFARCLARPLTGPGRTVSARCRVRILGSRGLAFRSPKGPGPKTWEFGKISRSRVTLEPTAIMAMGSTAGSSLSN